MSRNCFTKIPRDLHGIIILSFSLCLIFTSKSFPFPNPGNGEFIRSSILTSAALLESFGELERANSIIRQSMLASSDMTFTPGSPALLKTRLLVKLGFYERADTLLASMTIGKDDSTLFLYNLARARLNLLSGRNERALYYASLLDTLSPGIYQTYGQLLKMEILYKIGKYEQVTAIGSNVPKERCSRILKQSWQDVACKALMNTAEYKQALRLINEIEKREGWKKETLPFIERKMEIYLATNDTLGARELAYAAAGKISNTDPAAKFARNVLALCPLSSFKDYELLALCSVLINSRDIQEAEEIIDELNGRHLKVGFEEKLRYLQSRLLMLQRRYEKAISLLKKEFTNPELSKNSMLLIARSYRGIRNYLKAADAYYRYAVHYPRSRLAPEAMMVASGLYEKINYRTKARRLKYRLAALYPNNYYGHIASLRLATACLKRRDFSSATSILERAISKSSGDNEDLLYYLSQSYAKMGKAKESASAQASLYAADSTSFYLFPSISNDYRLPHLTSRGRVALVGPEGLLPLLKALDKKRKKAFDLIIGAIKDSENGSARIKDENFQKGVNFLEIGFTDWAIGELDLFFEKNATANDALLELGMLYCKYGDIRHSIRIFDRLHARLSRNKKLKQNRAFEALLYPVPFPGIVLENCAFYKLPPTLICALIREESRFDVRAVSRSGALGLMQIMPETGKSIAIEMGFPMQNDESLLNPEINIALGMRYLSHLLRQCKGNYHMMLSAYNAGLSNAGRWFDNTESDARIQEVVDGIDFKETRLYVRRIVETYHKYLSILDSKCRSQSDD